MYSSPLQSPPSFYSRWASSPWTTAKRRHGDAERCGRSERAADDGDGGGAEPAREGYHSGSSAETVGEALHRGPAAALALSRSRSTHLSVSSPTLLLIQILIIQTIEITYVYRYFHLFTLSTTRQLPFFTVSDKKCHRPPFFGFAQIILIIIEQSANNYKISLLSYSFIQFPFCFQIFLV